MSKRDNLLEHYQKVLTDLNFFVDEETGRISYGPERHEVLINDKNWVLPVESVLDESPWKTCFGFHPMAQNVIMAESETSNYLQLAINLAINMRVSVIMKSMVDFAANPSAHGNVPAAASKFLTKVSSMKPTASAHFASILKAAPATDSSRRFLSFYTKINGTLDGTKHKRLMVVSSPFLDDIVNGEGKIFSVKVTKDDLVNFRELFELILPGVDDHSTYSRGSSVSDGPSYIAQLKAFSAVAERLNEVLDTYCHLSEGQKKKKVTNVIDPDKYDELRFNLDWVEDLDHLKGWAGAIPPLPGSRGEEILHRNTDAGAHGTTDVSSKFQRKSEEGERPAERQEKSEPWEGDRAPARSESKSKESDKGISLADRLNGGPRRRDDRDYDRDYDRRRDRDRDYDRRDDRRSDTSWTRDFGSNRSVNFDDDRGPRRRDDRDDRDDRYGSSRRGSSLSDRLGGGSRYRGRGGI